MSDSKTLRDQRLEGTTSSIEIRLTGFASSPAAAQATYQATLGWFADWGDTPEKGALGGGKHRGMIVQAKSVARTLEKSGFDLIEYCHLWREDEPRDRVRAMGMYGGAVSTGHANFSVACAAHPIEIESLVAPLGKLVAMLESDAGEITLPVDLEAPLKVPGLALNIQRHLEDWRSHAEHGGMSAWSRTQIGAVNTLNLLPSAALESKIDGRSLREWIAADAARGQLRELSPTAWLWAIDTAQRAIMFKALSDAGIIFDGKRYFNEVVWREIPDAILQKTYDRQTLRKVIESGPGNGVLEALSGGQHRWGLKRGFESQLTKFKYEFNFIVDADGKIVDGPRKKPSKVRLAALDKRNALIAKVEAQQEQGHDLGLLALDEFFDGNFDEYSLAANLGAGGRPTLKRCHKILSDLRAREDVRDVFFEIQECPEVDDESEDDLWLICNDVLVITSAPLEVVQRAVSKLNADKVGEPGPTVSARVAAHAGLTLARDECVVALWWD